MLSFERYKLICSEYSVLHKHFALYTNVFSI